MISPGSNHVATVTSALPGPTNCPVVPFTVLVPQNRDEPTLSIPIPSGWQESDKHNSTLIRGAILAPGLRANDFTPNAVVTLADVTQDSDTPQKAIETETQGLATKVTIESQTSGTRCGFPAKTINYKVEGRPATSLIIAAKDDKGRVWVSTVAIQTTDPNNPDYVQAKQLIIGGYKVTTGGSVAG